MGEVNKAKTHKVVMDNRNSLSMTGISKVTSIDPDLVLLVTEQGKLKIIGKNMQATNLDLDKGILDLTGNINSAWCCILNRGNDDIADIRISSN